ncbi:hypothetical protein ABM428_17505 (plasmid) [Sulfitobacter sp. TCYB15]|uniref:Uncharacterized protein n=1 Tax=Sulfitobacter sp. TCYB15 TaxID=3229275 RepID=A0AAU8C8E9_9RHOB
MEVVNELGTSTVFDNPFIADSLAWEQFEETVKEVGPAAFFSKKEKRLFFPLTHARLHNPQIFEVRGLQSLATLAASGDTSAMQTR